MPKGMLPPQGESALSKLKVSISPTQSPAKTPFKTPAPQSGMHIMNESIYRSSIARHDFANVWLAHDSARATPNT
jgi:hypothetical protein